MVTSIEAFEQYLRLEKKYSNHTITAYNNDLVSFRDFVFLRYQQATIDDVLYVQIRAWIVELVDQSLSNTTINRKVASLKAFYKFLLRSKQIKASPLATHKALKTPKIIQIPFSEQEMVQVAEVFPKGTDFESVRNQLIVELFYATGMRRAELIGLEFKNVDLGSGIIKVLGKRQKERLLPVLPFLLDSIKKYLVVRSDLEIVEDSGYFFLTKKGTKLNESLVYRLINSYFSEVSHKLKKSPHILRHTFATHLLNNGADLNSVKELLGHASLASTQVYTHSSLSVLQEVHKKAHPRG
ncbi:tyrosine-type recombinase/integrase [Flavobacterium turcicum]|uniref:Tyrosine recombinase XerC n=1 Tax=Flavobacterium turcicum TaxID=2764718 RepID=A0ABR7JJG8_9FLAO|nr:tyrosine-type recombinase/integrase [Flavobacterium turcicum]MBC5864518.1 tyrosine-type recombinase/integrase [Flavobacterium turcicum]NHL03285.1 tyrosine-type recombinase/integrase [Flavobacterium turcicum]